MKKVLPLIALVILFITACKKDNPEPDPPPIVTSAMQQTLDGKVISFTNGWGRNIDSSGTLFLGINNVQDSMAFWDSYRGTHLVDSFFTYQINTFDTIKFISSNIIQLTNSASSNSVRLHYTGDYQSTHWVFSYYYFDSEADTSTAYMNSKFSPAADISPFIDFSKGVTAPIRSYSWVDPNFEYDYSEFDQLYLPMNNSDSVFRLYMGNSWNHSDFFTDYYDGSSLDTSVTNNLPYGANHYNRFGAEENVINGYNTNYSTGTRN